MAVKIRKDRALGALSLTPLIDVVFLLLIFFLVATRFAQEERELDVQLPSASDARPMAEVPQEIWINIDHQGNYVVNGVQMSGQELERLLRTSGTDNPVGQSVTIRADKRVAFDSVVQVMNLCNKAAIYDYKVTAQK